MTAARALKDVRLTVRVPVEGLQRLDDIAAREGISRSLLVRQMLAQGAYDYRIGFVRPVPHAELFGGES